MVNTKIPVSGRSLDRATGSSDNLNAENSERFVDQATSVKLPKSQAASLKPQAASVKLQASSFNGQATSSKLFGFEPQAQGSSLKP